MSLKLMQAFMETDLPPTERFVGLMLGNHCNDETGRCDPSLLTIRDNTGLSEASIKRAIASLERKGHIQIVRQTGTRNRYKLTPIRSLNRAHHDTGITVTPVSPCTPTQLTMSLDPAHSEPRTRKNQKKPNIPAAKGDGGDEKPDPRHHVITQRWSAVYREATGQACSFDTRGPKELQKFLKHRPETAEALLAVAAECFATAHTNRFASRCKQGVTLTGFCAHFDAIVAELNSYRSRGGVSRNGSTIGAPTQSLNNTAST